LEYLPVVRYHVTQAILSGPTLASENYTPPCCRSGQAVASDRCVPALRLCASLVNTLTSVCRATRSAATATDVKDADARVEPSARSWPSRQSWGQSDPAAYKLWNLYLRTRNPRILHLGRNAAAQAQACWPAHRAAEQCCGWQLAEAGAERTPGIEHQVDRDGNDARQNPGNDATN
jgi:hypothetical protein